MTLTDTSTTPPANPATQPPPNQPPVPPKAAAVLAGLAALTVAAIGLITSFNTVHWTSAQTTLVVAEAAACWALAGAVTAHLWPQTKKQPVAVLISLVTAIVAVASALAARSQVEPVTTPAAIAGTDLGPAIDS